MLGRGFVAKLADRGERVGLKANRDWADSETFEKKARRKEDISFLSYRKNWNN